MKKILTLIGSILVCQLAGIVGSFFTVSSVNSWYPELIKPVFNPPSWVFGPVWILLYTLMGIALFLVLWDRRAMVIFAVQLVLNALWSILFFGFQNPFLALIDIILLFVAISWTMIVFEKIDKRTVYLLAPYLAWVGFATVLNFEIVRLNSLWIIIFS